MVKEPARMGVKQNYRLFIDTELYQYMMVLARESAPNEILGMGMISMQECGHCTEFLLEEVFVPNQFVAPEYCTFKIGAQNEIIDEVLARGDSPEGLCFRWHSHGNGPVFFSTIDEEDIDNCDSPYVVNLVVNSRQDMVARLDIFEPVRVRNIPVDVVVVPTTDAALSAECRQEIAKCCEVMAVKGFRPLTPPRSVKMRKNSIDPPDDFDPVELFDVL